MDSMRAVIKFFTSVKLAIVLLILIIVASILGTLIPQGGSAQEYLIRYGRLSGLLQRLQFTGLYQSLWYVALLGLFALNIVICTLERLSPKFKRTFSPKVESEPRSIMALKIKEKLRAGASFAAAREQTRQVIQRHHYRLKENEAEGRAYIYARKKILGWFGSDVVHVGLLVILAGGITSGLGRVRGNLILIEGQALPVSGAGFSVRLDKFVTELYPNGSIKDWKSILTVIESDKPILQKTIEVNHPLSYRRYVFYQSGYGWDWQNPALEVWVKKKSDPAYLKKIWLRVGEKSGLEGENLEISVARFFPDFVLDEKNQPATRSLEPNNPAAFVEGWEAGEPIFSGWVFAKFPDFTRLHATKETDISFELKDIQAPQYSVIQMTKDPGVLLIWVGCSLLMVGLILAFYWPPREIRLVLEAKEEKTDIYAGGITPKSRETFESEFAGIIQILRKIK
jgi:cytochrome c biogenesis protein